MPKVLARQCPFTKKFFPLSHKRNYLNHLKKLRAEMAEDRRMARINRDADALRGQIFACKTVPELSRFLMENQKMILLFEKELMTEWRKEDIPVKIIKIEFTQMRHAQKVSNSHHAPVGQPTNWEGKQDIPTHFEGVKGRIQLHFKNGYGGRRISGILERLGVCTGSGGGGGNSLGYEVILWLDDFQALKASLDECVKKRNEVAEVLKEKYMEDNVIKRLKGALIPSFEMPEVDYTGVLYE